MCNCKTDKNCCKDVQKTSKGERGKKGDTGVGLTGPIGLTGPQGLAGSNGANGTNGINGLPGPQGIPGTPGSGNMPIDTDWEDLIGFSHYTAARKPQCRRIGNVIYFRGIAVVPLALNILTPTIGRQDLVSFASYNTIASAATYTGVLSGCLLPPGSPGVVQFNLGGNCIPVAVAQAITQLDDTYYKKNIIATRDVTISLTTAVTLSTVVSIGMTAGKNLFIETLEDLEFTNDRPSNTAQSSPLHFISSNAALNDYIPNYRITTPVHLTTETNLHASPLSVSPSTHNIKAPYATQYPFAVNLGNSRTIGGLQIQLDGFHVFLDTCNIDNTPGQAC